MKDKDSTRLQHMLDYAREAKAMATGHQRLDLDSDRTLMFALAKLVEIIGEAAASISQGTRDRLP